MLLPPLSTLKIHPSIPRQIWSGCGCGDFIDFGTFKKFVHGIGGSEIAAALGPFKEVPEDFNATIGAKSMSAKLSQPPMRSSMLPAFMFSRPHTVKAHPT